MFGVEDGGMDTLGLIVAVIITSITMIIGMSVISNISTTLPSMDRSTLSSTMSVILRRVGGTFNYLALGQFLLSALFIIGITAVVMGRE